MTKMYGNKKINKGKVEVSENNSEENFEKIRKEWNLCNKLYKKM